MAKIMVVGAGGWGTALGLMAHRYGHEVTLWSPFSEEIERLRRDQEHKKLLPGVPIWSSWRCPRLRWKAPPAAYSRF